MQSTFDKKNWILLAIAFIALTLGFIAMKMESAPHGYGFLALTIAPVLVLAGFALGFVSIFYTQGKSAFSTKKLPIVIGGWLVFLITFTIFWNTMEETASLWDCAEFIACAYKLQVPHAPGAPVFLMVGRLFSMLAMGDATQVAYWVNMSSVVSSAIAAMFVFWSVVMLVQMIDPKASYFALILFGTVGALSTAFADSFWFSAVEAETYAMATLVIIVAFWAGLKFYRCMNPESENRWILFLFFLLGVSIGIHPMSLLIIPTVLVLMVLKHQQFTWKLLLLVLACGGVLILFFNNVVLFGLPEVMERFDIIFVNSLGFPFFSGAAFVLVLLVVTGYFIFRFARLRNHRYLGVATIGMLYFLFGYASYFMILIRSQADPSIDEHNPENLATLVSYLKRESYGSRPFLYGPNFTAKVTSYEQGEPVYSVVEDRYKVTNHRINYTYGKNGETIFPRMYSTDPRHVNTYKEWTGLKDGQRPKLTDHLKFMLHYQLGHMYIRYLMFNFSGRQSDVQHVSWLGPWDAYVTWPDDIATNNAHNNFLMLPLLLGLLGMFFHFKRDKIGFGALMAMFLFLGAILAFYLNATPNEPRERDYIYVGSFVAFSMWCGIGSFAIFNFVANTKLHAYWVKAASILTLAVPLLMLFVGYDDHNRSGRTLHVDHARNTLASCEPNAILFTGGDNDTFPLWYVQEVEGFRTDVRVIVLSYFNTDWYIDQMKRDIYESKALPFSLQPDQYRQGGLNDILPFVQRKQVEDGIDLSQYLALIRNEKKVLQVKMAAGTDYNSVPSRNFILTIDQEEIKQNELVPAAYVPFIPEHLNIRWKGNYLEKNNLMVLDLIATNHWERPIYFNLTSINSLSIDLKKNVLLQGPIYRLLPIEMDKEGSIDLDALYTNLLEKATYQDLDNESVYYTYEDHRLRILQNIRSNYNTLSAGLLQAGEHDKAGQVLKLLAGKFYGENKSTDYSTMQTVDLLFSVGKREHATSLANQIFIKADQQLSFFKDRKKLDRSNSQIQLIMLRDLHRIAKRHDQPGLAKKCGDKFQVYYSSIGE